MSAEELHRYMGIDKADAMEVSAVDWWAAREDKTALAHIAAMHLCLLTTSVDVERLFSHYKMLLSQHRRSLIEKNNNFVDCKV